MKSKSGFMNDLWSRREFVRLGGSVAASGLLPAWPSLSVASSSSAKPGTYMNPVIAGDHPDAGAIRVGKDYYLVHTTDHYTPGLLIWHSTDLVHWKVAGAALDQYYGAVWAPFLCEYKGLFYIYYPCDGKIFVLMRPQSSGTMEQAGLPRYQTGHRSDTWCYSGRPPRPLSGGRFHGGASADGFR